MIARLLLGLTLVAALAGCERQPRAGADAAALRQLVGSEPIVVLSTQQCGYCMKLRTDLGAWGVRYRDVDVERSDEGRRAFALLRASGVPIVLIDDTVVHGYAPRRIRRLLVEAELLPAGAASPSS